MSDHWCLCTDLFRQGRLEPTNVGMLSCSRLREAGRHLQESTLGLRFHASMPIRFQDRPLGIMNVTGPSDRKLNEDELALLATIAYQLGIAVERARLAEGSLRLARAEERTRIAREIHDTLAQGLAAIGLDIEGALRHLDDSPQRARERLERALQTTRGSLEDARRSVLDLRSGVPSGRPLADALVALGRGFTAETGVPVHVESRGARPIDPRIEAELFRIAQEALANVRKHARATAVSVALRLSGSRLHLTIGDDGVGFERHAPTTGHGLIGIRERAKLIDARVRIRSKPGAGTSIAIDVRLPAEDSS
jgi:two-component system NarL family sensor kinase